MEMTRISMLLFKLSILQMIVSVYLFAQYSHFPLTPLEIDRIESEKFTETLAVSTFSEITPAMVKFPSPDSQPTIATVTKSPIENETSLLDHLSLELPSVDLGISQDPIDKSNLDLKYIEELPSTPRIDFPDSSTFFDDLVFFLKDLFDDDNNFSEEYRSYNITTPINFEYLFNASRTEKSHSKINNSLISTSLVRSQIQSNYLEKKDITNVKNSPVNLNSNLINPKHADQEDQIQPSEKLFTIDYSIPQGPLVVDFNVFQLDDVKNEPNLTDIKSSQTKSSKRNRRAFTSGNNSDAWDGSASFTWEINDFDPAGSNDPVQTFGTPKTDDLSLLNTNNKMDVNITASGGIGSLSVFAYGLIGGGNWQDQHPGFHFMTGGGGPTTSNNVDTNVSDYFNLDASRINAYINAGGHNTGYFDWSVWKNNDNYYFRYDFDESSLAMHQAPEPSTYVMTGALLCFIGFNQKSCKSLKRILSLLSNKLNLPSCIEKLTRSQSHS
jgi:hypothetical protein